MQAIKNVNNFITFDWCVSKTGATVTGLPCARFAGYVYAI